MIKEFSEIFKQHTINIGQITRISHFFNKNLCIRFRCNNSYYKHGVRDFRGDIYFHKLLSHYVTKPNSVDFCLYDYKQKVSEESVSLMKEFFSKHELNIISTYYHDCAGLKFSSEKMKKFFLLKYNDYFPEQSLIKT